ncbi:hypothetical protein [Nocardia carnea]|uniref:hypothetical protein n=1 Tax=Nocardia carnea TaxID=37328 RepID=UPI002457071E|nr:hypothetical protein [Nocardia carnea]
MPKSKGRKPKRATTRSHGRRARAESGYDPGRLGIPARLIANMVAAAPPDQLVEMLPPFLWLHHSTGIRADLCVSAAISLHHAYDLIGITARPTAVELVITHQTRGTLTRYGSGGASWDGEQFNAHCVLWLPGSGRWVDATVMQYPEVRASMPLPVIGRMAGSIGGGPASRASLAEGRLAAGTHMTVPREDLILDYTVLTADPHVITDPFTTDPEKAALFRSSGINLISNALEWWRRPGIVERARTAPYPRLHALLDAVGQAPVHVDADGNRTFETTPGSRTRINELLPAA